MGLCFPLQSTPSENLSLIWLLKWGLFAGACAIATLYIVHHHGILQTPSTIHCIRSTLVHWVLAVSGELSGHVFQVYFLTDEETEAWRGDSGRAYCVKPRTGAGSLAPASTLLLQFRSCSLSHLEAHPENTASGFQSYHLTISLFVLELLFFPFFPQVISRWIC